jgi:hypothetical protein
VPRDIQPLSRTRMTQILRLARKHPELQSVLSERGQALFIEPNITDRGQPEGADQAVVGVYDYANDRSLVALVDPKRGEVVSVEETAAKFQLNDEERAEAERLAGADERVQDFLAGRPLQALTRLYFPPQPGGNDPSHRYAVVFVRPDNQARRYAVVDLSEGIVVDVLRPEALNAEESS